MIYPRTPQALSALAVLAMATSCSINMDLNGDGDYPSADGTYTSAMCKSTATPISRPNEGRWTTIYLDDVAPRGPNDAPYTCADGTPYKFFVQFNTGATDLTVAFEPGGACWDHKSCSKDVGMLSPKRMTTVPDDLMTYINEDDPNNTPWAAMYPHFGRIDNSVPTNKYNHVFFPYCTGDAFTANKTVTYKAPGKTDLTVRHHGRRNTEAAMTWLKQTFPTGYTGQLLVVGSSAGAVGATVNYPLVRDTVKPKCGAMVSDAGPIFPPKNSAGAALPPYTPSPQEQLTDRVSAAWGLEEPGGIVGKLDTRFASPSYRALRNHMGHINRGLSRTFPKDRFLFTTFKQDLNFSLYSFVGGGLIEPGPDIADDVIDMWQEEVADFKTWIDADTTQNWGYYLPNFRPDNCSHMVATAPFTLARDLYGYALDGLEGHANGYYRTEIGNMNLGTAIRQLLDPSKPLPRADAPYQATQLSYLSEPGQGVASDDWYDLRTGFVNNKEDYVRQQRIDCVNTNGFPQ